MDKPSYEWEEEDVERLILNKIQESTNLDYKRSYALRIDKQSKEKIVSEISKDVSSFANSNGGTMIYGIIEDNHLPKEIDEGFDPTSTRREWLEDIIDSNVKPKIEGLKVKQIVLKRTHPGKVIYAVNIPQSLQGAIQAKDFRYYQRRNFKAEPMEDYQIRDVMNRYKYPILGLDITTRRFRTEPSYNEYELILRLSNKGVITARSFGFDLLFPISFAFQHRGASNVLQLQEYGFSEFTTSDPSVAKGLKYRNPSPLVIFPTDSIDIIGTDVVKFYYRIDDKVYPKFQIHRISAIIYADDMTPKRSEYLLSELVSGI